MFSIICDPKDLLEAKLKELQDEYDYIVAGLIELDSEDEENRKYELYNEICEIQDKLDELKDMG